MTPEEKLLAEFLVWRDRDYVTVEYREGHEAQDIQELLGTFGGWRLVKVLESCNVMILERVRPV